MQNIYDIAVSRQFEGYYFKWQDANKVDNWTVTYDLASICSLCRLMSNDTWYMFGTLEKGWSVFVDVEGISRIL